MPQKSNKHLYIVALFLFLGGLGYLAVSSFYLNSKPWISVSQMMERTPVKPEAARIFGSVQSEGLAISKEGVGARFLLVDIENSQKKLWVSYSGVLPDTFEPGVEVIVDGTYSGPNSEFVSSKLLTKCPSKYEKNNREPSTSNKT